MDYVTPILNNAFVLTILVSAYWYIRRQLSRGDFGHRTIKFIFHLAAYMLVADGIRRFSCAIDAGNHIICYVCTMIITIFLPFLALLWFVYTCFATKLHIKLSIVYIVSGIIMAINLGLAIWSIIPGADIYFVFSESTMAMGRYYFIYAGILLIPFVGSLVVIFLQWNRMNRIRNPFTFFNYSIIPIVAIIGQFFIEDYSLTMMGIVASFVVVVLDIQHHYAITDFLTGLYNRRNLIKYLNAKIKSMHPGDKFAGFMLDINNFKCINDKYGHNFGDKVLVEVANLLIGATDRGDYIARFGGDEFVIIINMKDEQEIARFKHSLCKACEAYNNREASSHCIDFSIGAAIYNKEDGMSAITFLEIIDDRMYIDKQATKAI